MTTTQQEIIARLRLDIAAWEGCRPNKACEGESFGLGPIEQAFPGKVFPTGALHEFVSTSPEQTAAIGGFLSGLISTEAQSRCVLLSVEVMVVHGETGDIL